jgi:hypothetical protein
VIVTGPKLCSIDYGVREMMWAGGQRHDSGDTRQNCVPNPKGLRASDNGQTHLGGLHKNVPKAFHIRRKQQTVGLFCRHAPVRLPSRKEALYLRFGRSHF